jgi:hypothetical protein
MACIASTISRTDMPDMRATDTKTANVATIPLPSDEKSCGVNGIPGPVIALNSKHSPPKKPIVLEDESFD